MVRNGLLRRPVLFEDRRNLAYDASMNSWVFLAAGGVFILGVIVYLAFMIFLPEWVGISGKVAREAERSHRGDGLDEDTSETKPD